MVRLGSQTDSRWGPRRPGVIARYAGLRERFARDGAPAAHDGDTGPRGGVTLADDGALTTGSAAAWRVWLDELRATLPIVPIGVVTLADPFRHDDPGAALGALVLDHRAGEIGAHVIRVEWGDGGGALFP